MIDPSINISTVECAILLSELCLFYEKKMKQKASSGNAHKKVR